MKKVLLYSFFIFSLISISGCEKQEFFRSEKGVGKDLEGKWKLIRIATSDPENEIWNFHDGILTISTPNKSDVNGTYSIKTTLFKVFVTTAGLNSSCLNGKWQVILLDGSALDMVNDACAGLTEKEFTKL